MKRKESQIEDRRKCSICRLRDPCRDVIGMRVCHPMPRYAAPDTGVDRPLLIADGEVALTEVSLSIRRRPHHDHPAHPMSISSGHFLSHYVGESPSPGNMGHRGQDRCKGSPRPPSMPSSSCIASCITDATSGMQLGWPVLRSSPAISGLPPTQTAGQPATNARSPSGDETEPV